VIDKKTVVILCNVSNVLDFRRDLIRELTHKYHVTIVCEDERYIPSYREMGCNYIHSRSSQHGTNPFMELVTIVDYIRILRAIKPELVITYTIKPNIYGGMACALLHLPYITNITGLSDAIVSGGAMSRLLLLMYRLALRKTDTIVFQNTSSAELFERRRISRGNSIVVSGSGVNLDEHPYEQYPENSGELTLLTLGRIMKAKGIDELLEAAEIIRKQYPFVHFKLLGTIHENYETKIAQAVSVGTVEYCGHTEDVRPFLKDSHATIHASYHEGMSNALLETASTGRPIIATNIPGCRETFDEGITGIGFKPKDSNDLVRAIEQFIAIPYKKKKRMGLAGRKKMEREFDRRDVTSKHLAIIERAIGS